MKFSLNNFDMPVLFVHILCLFHIQGASGNASKLLQAYKEIWGVIAV